MGLVNQPLKWFSSQASADCGKKLAMYFVCILNSR